MRTKTPAPGARAAELYTAGDVVGRSLLHYRADRLRKSSRPRSGASRCCRRVSLPAQDTAPLALGGGSCRPARSLLSPRRPPRKFVRAPAQNDRRSRASSSTAGVCRPGTFEVRRAALIINYTPKTERNITQRELELQISNELESVPDIRFWFLDENGSARDIAGRYRCGQQTSSPTSPANWATQMKRISPDCQT